MYVNQFTSVRWYHLILLLIIAPICTTVALQSDIAASYQTTIMQQQSQLRAAPASFDLDAVPVHRSPMRDQNIARWQLFLMRLGCSMYFKAASLYDYIILKINAINHYFHPTTDTTQTYSARMQDEWFDE